LLEIFQTPAGEDHSRHMVEQAHRLGLTDTALLDYNQLQELEPQTKINAIGAVWFKCDAHLYPNKLMQQLLADLKQKGVKLVTNEEVNKFEHTNGNITKVITSKNGYDAEHVVVASGSWSRELAEKIEVKIPLVPGRGYSVTLEDSPYKINYPAVLVEGRAALTPMDGNKIRFGGTMEITSTQNTTDDEPCGRFAAGSGTFLS
jgi:D-amino-acid dehydrogenase